MAASMKDTPAEPFDLIELIREQVRSNPNSDDDVEWQLFSRFRESIYRFARQQMSSDAEREEQLEQFAKLTTNEERVAQLLDNKHFNAVFEMLLKEVATSGSTKSAKDAAKAKETRERGNEQFKSKQFEQACKSYSEVISDSHAYQLSLGYVGN